MNDGTQAGGYYYYAGGQAIPLELDDESLAVNTQQLEALEHDTKRLAELRAAAQPLRAGLTLLPRSLLSDAQVHSLAQEGAAHPVFRAEGAKIVVLPEVRVEDPSPRCQQEIGRWLSNHASEAQVVQHAGERIVLRPTSGRGIDALALANQLTEQVGPEMAQARFLRVTDRPS